MCPRWDVFAIGYKKYNWHHLFSVSFVWIRFAVYFIYVIQEYDDTWRKQKSLDITPTTDKTFQSKIPEIFWHSVYRKAITPTRTRNRTDRKCHVTFWFKIFMKCLDFAYIVVILELLMNICRDQLLLTKCYRWNKPFLRDQCQLKKHHELMPFVKTVPTYK